MRAWTSVLMLVACDRTPRQTPIPADWTPVPLAHVVVPPGTPCADGLDWLYTANCTGQESQPICVRYVELLGLFELPAQGIHCDPRGREETQALALRFVQRTQQHAPPEMQNDPSMARRVDDQRLWLLDGFVQAIVEQARPRVGQEAAALVFRDAYRPTDFSKALAR